MPRAPTALRGGAYQLRIASERRVQKRFDDGGVELGACAAHELGACLAVIASGLWARSLMIAV